MRIDISPLSFPQLRSSGALVRTPGSSWSFFHRRITMLTSITSFVQDES